MPTMRTYGDGCGIAHALDLVGERWALLVVRELVLGPKRFTDIRAGLPNASPNVLAQRLRELEQAAIVRRRKLPPPAGSWVYELTDWGRELEPMGAALAVVPARRPPRRRLRRARPRDVLRRAGRRGTERPVRAAAR
jgi:DNA-binding HxlR family transcriptional regulator